MKYLILILTLITSINSFSDELPEGWFKVGSNPQGYDAFTVSDVGMNPPVATLKSNAQADNFKFGTVMQSFTPEDYLGKRIEMTVWIKSEDVNGWSGAWLRIDGQGGKTYAFDNMMGREIKGTTDWINYSIVLDVPKNAVSLNYGVLLAGKGQVWFDEFNFSVVPDSEAVTDLKGKKNFRTKPLNNDF